MKQAGVSTEDIELRLLLEAIYARYHYDFRDYSLASMKRRLKQVVPRLDCPSISALQAKVLHDPAVFAELLPLLTVQVSEMFRDPGYFRALRHEVIPHLKTFPSLKVWVAGCSTGEEVYSLAILFREEGLGDRVMVYGTDINPEALRKAEAGVYDLERMPLFTSNYQLSGSRAAFSDYYTAAYGAAIFDRSLRHNVVFSDHSLVSDHVFAELQLVSCRNVLIYFERRLQDRAVGLFKDSLVHNGFLGIGSKETLRLSVHAGAFEEFSREQRLYRRKST